MDRAARRSEAAMNGAGAIAIRLGLAGLLGVSAAVGAPERGPMSAPTALRLAITELTREAGEAHRAGDLAHRQADFAARFPHAGAINPEALWRKLASPAHHDPFIDSYVRWQLSSLAPASVPPPHLSPREFERLLERFPPLMPNPRADEAMIVALRDASLAGPLSERDQKRFEALMNELAKEAGRAHALASPALALREWWHEQLKGDAVRSIHLQLERCAALAGAGWNVDEVKAGLDDALATISRDREVDAAERAAIAGRATELVTIRRMFIESAAIIEGSLILTLREAAVYEFDVVRWNRELRAE
jgi:hypothetical protein